MHAADHTHTVKAQAKLQGFDFCGIARAEFLQDDAIRLERWLNKGMQGNMNYMERYFELRVDPTKLVPGARSVITLLLNYFPAQTQTSGSPKVSKYAFGKDYHDVIREKLNIFLAELRQRIGDFEGRGFVDSAPVLERSWAQKGGLGWIGKNGNLLTKSAGSYFFIATLITDLELIADAPFAADYCGTCNRCAEACPTDAILPGKIVDGSKCISYFTIELKDLLIPDTMKGKFKDWVFGCDICQDVCPWNRFSKPTAEIAFTPIPEILNFTTGQWDELTEESFRGIFKDSPIKRTKFSGLKRNLQFIREA
jgi:epoxyqueuosine reductase